MHWVLRRLYRERRRVVVVALITFLGGYIAFFNRDSSVFGLPLPILAGLSFMVVLTTFLMVVVILFPKVRHCGEAVGLSVPILSLMGAFGSAEDGGLSSFSGIYIVMLSYLTITVYGGAWVDRYLPCRPKQFVSKAKSRLSVEELWPFLSVTPDTFQDFGKKDVVSMEWIEPGVSYRQFCRSGELAKIEELHTITDNEPHQRFGFSFDVPDATKDAAVSCGHIDVRLIPHGSTTRVETTREFDRVSVRAQLFIWIDDAMGRLDDELLQNAEAKLRT